MTRYRVSYWDYETDKHVAADGPQRMDRDEILALMAEVLTSAGSYVSVMDDDGTMLQFVIDEDGSVMFDIPHPAKRGSYAKKTDMATCVRAIEELGDKVDFDAYDGLVFERW